MSVYWFVYLVIGFTISVLLYYYTDEFEDGIEEAIKESPEALDYFNENTLLIIYIVLKTLEWPLVILIKIIKYFKK